MKGIVHLSKEVAYLSRFLRIPKADRTIMFYATQEDCYPSFEGLVKELDGCHNPTLCYVTSDLSDPILQRPNLGTFYVNKLFPLFAAFVDCKVLIMTLTDLNQFHIRRSTNPVHYVYVFHSLVSTHMVYLQGAFDHYDSVLCCGPHQVKEIRRREELRGLPPKRLIEAGYYRLERIYEAYQRRSKGPSTKAAVLIAPSWGANNILEVCGKRLVKLLLEAEHRVVVRPHPETVRRLPSLIKQYALEFGNNPNFALETSVATDTSLLAADVLVSDYSGIALEYAFGTERPVIFLDVPPKIRNSKYKELGLGPIEVSLRDEIGTIVSPENIEDIPNVIQDGLSNRAAWKDKLSKLRSEYVFNFGQASKVGASYIRSLL